MEVGAAEQRKQVKVAAMLQIRLLRQMTGGDEAGMPPAMAAPLRDCSEQVCWRQGCGRPAVMGCMGHFDGTKDV
jgi:hypothetical protein